MLRKSLVTALSASLLFGACADDQPPPVDPTDPGQQNLLDGSEFVAIPYTVGADVASTRRRKLAENGAPIARTRAGVQQDFYLAIKKDSLAKKWFLSAFMEQYFPGAVNGGAAMSLGTQVVTFKIQNGKLFVVNADDRHKSSDVFDPTILIEAYPLVDNDVTRGQPGWRDYVFIDPAAGLDRFDVTSDLFAQYTFTRFTTELAFSQNFKKLADGASFEQVFTGYAEAPINQDPSGVDPNPFRASGTLGISLRHYSEGSGYHEVPLPGPEFYFRSDPKLVPDSGGVLQTAAHWDIHPGMRPIEWVISPEIRKTNQSRPDLAGVDLYKAVKDGIESWNSVFGYTVFTAREARPDESFGDDSKNYIIFDPDPSLGYAFANWRTNPNTGEIRGASVYWGAGWLNPSWFSDDPAGGGGSPSQPSARKPKVVKPVVVKHPSVPSIRWNGAGGDLLCAQWAGDEVPHALPGGGAGTHLTAGQKFEKYIGQMMTHEIGHDLGLRHNFKGSLMPPSSSTMEYMGLQARIDVGIGPRPYDVDAIKYLYGLSPDLPTQPFCTDESNGLEPDCDVFDEGADPLTEYWQPWYEAIRDFYTQTGFPYDEGFLDAYAGGVVHYITNGDPTQAQRAWDIAIAKVSAPLDPALAADPSFVPAGADSVLRYLIVKLNNHWLFGAQIDGQIAEVALDNDGYRTWESRRAMVDLLKAKQSLPSYQLLLDTRDRVAAQLAGGELVGNDELQAQDLLARIQRAVSPYFEQ